MIQAVQRIERSVKLRRQTDVVLINWWLYLLLLSWITFGIYGIYLYFKRMSRVDKFVRRRRDYYNATIDFTEKFAQQAGTYDEVRPQIEDLKSQLRADSENKLREIGAAVHFILTIITLGLWGFYVLYRLNRAWNDFQEVDQDFYDSLSPVWQRLKLSNYPLSFDIRQSKQRSYALYLILSFVTFGIWWLVWDYKIHTDPDDLYPEFYTLEDTVLQTVRQQSPASTQA
jgi:hypothetical protein